MIVHISGLVASSRSCGLLRTSRTTSRPSWTGVRPPDRSGTVGPTVANQRATRSVTPASSSGIRVATAKPRSVRTAGSIAACRADTTSRHFG
jgi:hypothetical protein